MEGRLWQQAADVHWEAALLLQPPGPNLLRRQKSVLNDHASTPAFLEDFDEVLKKWKCSFSGADGEVLLHLGAFLAAKGRIGQHDVVAVFLLNIGEVFGEGVGVDDFGASLAWRSG
jgi:hypothetical protein